MRITEEDILKAIKEATDREPDHPANIIRAAELQERLGWGHVQTRNLIRRWIAEGKAVPVKWPHRHMSGVVRKIEMYKVLELPE